jgi:hypothetical protein
MGNYGGLQWFNYTDRRDASYLSGTPSDPLGGGMGTAAYASSNFPYSLPFGGIATANSAGVGLLNASADAGDATQPNAVTFADLLTNGAADVLQPGWRAATAAIDSGENPVSLAKLQLNGHDRFSEREGRYFNLVQPFQHHTNCPATGINVYSFGLKPEEHQPSGTCNFSRIDNATLHLTLTALAVTSTAKVRVYATNYNVLRIMSGMGGLAYSN